MYTHSFLDSFLYRPKPEYWVEFPVLHSRRLSLIYSVCLCQPQFISSLFPYLGFPPAGSVGRVSALGAGDPGLILGFPVPWKGNSNPLQHPCLEHPLDRRTWWAAGHGVAESRLKWVTSTEHKDLLCSTGNSAPSSVMTYMGRDSKTEWLFGCV